VCDFRFSLATTKCLEQSLIFVFLSWPPPRHTKRWRRVTVHVRGGGGGGGGGGLRFFRHGNWSQCAASSPYLHLNPASPGRACTSQTTSCIISRTCCSPAAETPAIRPSVGEISRVARLPNEQQQQLVISGSSSMLIRVTLIFISFDDVNGVLFFFFLTQPESQNQRFSFCKKQNRLQRYFRSHRSAACRLL